MFFVLTQKRAKPGPKTPVADPRFHYYTIPNSVSGPRRGHWFLQSAEGWPGRESVQLLRVSLIITISTLIHPLITQCAQLEISQSEGPFTTCLQIIGLTGQVKVVFHCVRAFIGPFQ